MQLKATLEDGTVVTDSGDQNPVAFSIGAGEMLPAIDQGVLRSVCH